MRKLEPRERLFVEEEKIRRWMFEAMGDITSGGMPMLFELKDIIKKIDKLKVEFADRYYSHNNFDSLKDTCISAILRINPIDEDYKDYFGNDYDNLMSE
jgi:hypothetical protein